MALNDNEIPAKRGWNWGKLFQYFLQGVLVTAPLVITFYLIYWFVSSVDSLIPIFHGTDAAGNAVNRNYGSGFVILIIALIVIGYLSSNFITSRVFNVFDGWLERTPGIKFIYSSVKDFFEAFAGSKRKFNKAVLINIHGHDVWQIGFITDEDASHLGIADHITVYVPMSFSFAGSTYIVPKEKVRHIHNVSAGEALKYTISGGITEIEDEDHHKHRSHH